MIRNPKAPIRHVEVVESRQPLDELADRLRALGATSDEVAAVVDTWDRFGDDWTPEDQHRLLHSTDVYLAGQIAGVRDEYREHTTTEADDAVAAGRAAAAVREREAAVVMERARNVAEILEWVGTDADYAAAVLALEVAGRNRSTLVGPLRKLAG